MVTAAPETGATLFRTTLPAAGFAHSIGYDRKQAEAALGVPDGSGDIIVPGVAKLLRRAVRNLLENAARHGSAGQVSAGLSLADGHAELHVDDRGPGVPEAQRERIFEPFYRLPGASERDGGVGLGLALVRSIAERHGGSAQCDNCPGGGARFTLRLPTARHAA